VLAALCSAPEDRSGPKPVKHPLVDKYVAVRAFARTKGWARVEAVNEAQQVARVRWETVLVGSAQSESVPMQGIRGVSGTGLAKGTKLGRLFG
jgi:hypothetical protein